MNLLYSSPLPSRKLPQPTLVTIPSTPTKTETMHSETRTRIASRKRNTKSATNYVRERRGSHASQAVTGQSRSSDPSVRPMRAKDFKNDQWNTNNDTDTTKRQAFVPDYLEEVACATYELVEECCYAMTAISRAVVTSCRLVVRAATFMLAVTCLTLAAVAWVYDLGKNLWSTMSG